MATEIYDGYFHTSDFQHHLTDFNKEIFPEANASVAYDTMLREVNDLKLVLADKMKQLMEFEAAQSRPLQAFTEESLKTFWTRHVNASLSSENGITMKLKNLPMRYRVRYNGSSDDFRIIYVSKPLHKFELVLTQDDLSMCRYRPLVLYRMEHNRDEFPLFAGIEEGNYAHPHVSSGGNRNKFTFGGICFGNNNFRQDWTAKSRSFQAADVLIICDRAFQWFQDITTWDMYGTSPIPYVSVDSRVFEHTEDVPKLEDAFAVLQSLDSLDAIPTIVRDLEEALPDCMKFLANGLKYAREVVTLRPISDLLVHDAVRAQFVAMTYLETYSTMYALWFIMHRNGVLDPNHNTIVRSHPMFDVAKLDAVLQTNQPTQFTTFGEDGKLETESIYSSFMYYGNTWKDMLEAPYSLREVFMHRDGELSDLHRGILEKLNHPKPGVVEQVQAIYDRTIQHVLGNNN